MTPSDLKAWQKSMDYTYESAAAALGMSRSGYAKLVGGTAKIDRRTWLACAAISAGIGPWAPKQELQQGMYEQRRQTTFAT